MNVKKWFPHDQEGTNCKQLHVLHVFERSGRALEDCTSEFPIIVGRGADADVRIHDPKVSRIHCGLSRARGQIVLTDLESRNGTYLNGEPIMQRTLSEGDEVRIGSTVMVVINTADDAVLAIDMKD